MIWFILGGGFILYVIFTLSTIKYQLRLIINHLNINEEIQKIPNEEIEKELEDHLNG